MVQERTFASCSSSSSSSEPIAYPLTAFLQHSLVLLPGTHSLHEDARRTGKTQKKFGNISRASTSPFHPLPYIRLLLLALPPYLTPLLPPFAAAEDESRPTHLLRASMPKIKDFVASKVPLGVVPSAPSAAPSVASGTDTPMDEAQSVASADTGMTNGGGIGRGLF